MKKTIKSLLAIAIAAFALSACSDVPEPAGYSIQPKGGTPGGGDAIEVTCAEAVTATNNLADGATSTETYAVTGYITEVVGSVSRNQQTFWIADTKDGGKVFEAYFADLPDGVTEFKKGMKVKITGKLMKFVNSNTGAVTPEIKNAKVEILESSDEPGGGGGDEPTGNMTKKVEGTVVTFTSASVTGSDEVTVDFDQQGWADKAAATAITLTNGTTIEFGAGENTTAPTYYSATHGIRVYAKNTITIKGSKKIAKLLLNCDSYNGTDYVGNEMMYASEADKVVTICNDNTEAKGGVQLRVKTMVITFEGEGGGGGDQPGGGSTAVLDINFTQGQGSWLLKDVVKPADLTFVWQQTAQYGMKASAFANSTRYATDSWLVSPAFTLTKDATMTFSQAQRYSASGCTDLHVMYSASYTGGDIVASQWTEVTPSAWPDGTNWNFIDCTAAIPATAKYVAFRYTSTSSTAGTWEIKTVKIE